MTKEERELLLLIAEMTFDMFVCAAAERFGTVHESREECLQKYLDYTSPFVARFARLQLVFQTSDPQSDGSDDK